MPAEERQDLRQVWPSPPQAAPSAARALKTSTHESHLVSRVQSQSRLSHVFVNRAKINALANRIVFALQLVWTVVLALLRPVAQAVPWRFRTANAGALLGKTRKSLAAAGLVGLTGGALGLAIFIADAPLDSGRPAEAGTATLQNLAEEAAFSDLALRPGSSAISLAAIEPVNAPSPSPQAAPEWRGWTEIRHPIAMFHLEAPAVQTAELDYRVAVTQNGGRRDSLIWIPRPGTPGAPSRPEIDLEIERFSGSEPEQRAFFPQLALRAADRHRALEKLATPSEIVSKFGPLEVADAILSQKEGRAACLVFRRIGEAGFSFSGWYCAPKGTSVNRLVLTCFLDRLDLVGAGSDLPLKRLFAEAERRRAACPNARQPGRKISWLDADAPVPALKTARRPQ